MTRLFGFLACILCCLAACALAGCTPTPVVATAGAAAMTGAATDGAVSPSAAPTGTALPTIASRPAVSPTAAPSLGAATPRPAATKTPAPVRTATPAPPACTLESGAVITATIQTDLLRYPLAYRVYLPPCYDAHPREYYPSLYLFHGQSFTDDQWDRMGIDETADRLIAAGKIPPLIIVMPYDRYGGQPTETGFSDAVVQQLIPTIDTTYRTRARREFRAAGGLSRGAGWAIHFGVAYYPLFSRIGAHSAAVFHTDAQRMRTWLGKIPPEQLPQVYLDIGDRDRPEITRSTYWFEDLLNLYDVPHEFHLFQGYHAEAYWSAHLEDYLLWYTRDW